MSLLRPAWGTRPGRGRFSLATAPDRKTPLACVRIAWRKSERSRHTVAAFFPLSRALKKASTPVHSALDSRLLWPSPTPRPQKKSRPEGGLLTKHTGGVYLYRRKLKKDRRLTPGNSARVSPCPGEAPVAAKHTRRFSCFSGRSSLDHRHQPPPIADILPFSPLHLPRPIASVADAYIHIESLAHRHAAQGQRIQDKAPGFSTATAREAPASDLGRLDGLPQRED